MKRWQGLMMPAMLALLWLLAGCTAQPAQPTSGPPGAPGSLSTSGKEPSSTVPRTGTQLSPSPAEHVLPFETIERSDYSLYYHQHPLELQHVFLISSAEEVVHLADRVSPQTQEQLAQIDYGTYFVIALFRGSFGSSGYDAIIQRVARQGDKLVVYAQFWAPSPYTAVTAADSQPHHVIKVLRDGGPLQEADLQLESQAVTPTPPAEIRRLTPTPLR